VPGAARTSDRHAEMNPVGAFASCADVIERTEWRDLGVTPRHMALGSGREGDHLERLPPSLPAAGDLTLLDCGRYS